MTAFFDTNVLVYAVEDGGERQAAAKACLAGGGIVSVQVLNEFVSVCRSKLKRPWDEIEHELGLMRRLFETVLPLTVADHEEAIQLARDHHLHIYDALIVATALRAGCETLWSEDLNDGHRFGSLTVRNPFGRTAQAG